MFRLAPDEVVQIEMRKHWFVLLVELFGYALFYLAPFFLYGFFAGQELPLPSGNTFILELSPALGAFLGASWSLIIWMRAIGIWTDYYLDVWMVTSKRIVDLEQKGLFHRKSSVFRIERIQDVTVEVNGIIATLLNFGDIHVQTAGEAQEFVMKGIARPKYVREIILEQHDRVTELAPRTPVRQEDSVD